MSISFVSDMNECLKLEAGWAGLSVRIWVCSDLRSFSQLQSVFYVDAQIAHGAIDLGVTEENLNGAQITGRLVNNGGLRSPKRVRSVILRWQADADHPFSHKTGILARAHVGHVIVAAREDVVVQCTAASFQPRTYRFTSRIHKFELNRALGLLLYDDGAITDTSPRNQIADANFDDIAAAQLAIDGRSNSARSRNRRC